jgi:pyruvate dehydrogenase E1 component
MSLVRMLTRLMKDGDIGKYVVPIVPDEARTFGMDGLFRIAQDELAKQGIAADVYSVTSYNLLYRDAIECEQWNRAHPEEETRIPFLSRVLEGCSGKFVAASDYMKVLPASIARWVPGDLVCLGTDGYGLSESRPVIRDHFGVSAEYIIRAAGGEA